MWKAAGIATVLFGVGVGAMLSLAGVLGSAAEAAALMLVGVGLYGGATLLPTPGKALRPEEA
jgi:hypothetical protein